MESIKEEAVRYQDLVEFAKLKLRILISEPHELFSANFFVKLRVKCHIMS